MGTTAGGKRILLLAGDYVEDYEIMVNGQCPQSLSTYVALLEIVRKKFSWTPWYLFPDKKS